MKDRRSETSRANLGNHIPEPLAPEGTTTVAFKIPMRFVEKIEAHAAGEKMTRSEWLRLAVRTALDDFDAARDQASRTGKWAVRDEHEHMPEEPRPLYTIGTDPNDEADEGVEARLLYGRREDAELMAAAPDLRYALATLVELKDIKELLAAGKGGTAAKKKYLNEKEAAWEQARRVLASLPGEYPYG